MYYVDDVFIFNCDTVSGKKNDIDNQILRIRPNPSHGLFLLESDATYFDQIQVFDLLGHLVFCDNDKQRNHILIDLNTQSKGIYFLKVFYNNDSFQYKLIKN